MLRRFKQEIGANKKLAHSPFMKFHLFSLPDVAD